MSMSNTPTIRSAAANDAPTTRRNQLPHLAGFWVVAVSYMTLSAFGTAPTPLWPAYEQVDQFGPLVVTVAFATMVVGVAISLILFGHLSDRFGRRNIIVPALIVGIASAIILTSSSSLVSLLSGRFTTGLAIGLMAATATAYLSDLYRQARPSATNSGVPTMVAGVAGLGGLALGPLVTGTLAELLPNPLSTSYAAFGIAMLVLLALTLATPETVDRTAAALRHPPRFSLNPGARGTFIIGSSLGFYAFGVSGLFSSLGAIIIRGELGFSSVFVGGMATFVTFAASALSQIVFRNLQTRPMTLLGMVFFAGGLALTIISLLFPALWLFLAAAGLSGGGAGLLFKTGLGEAARSAVPASRAGVLATFFIVSYAGLGIPSILFALTLQSADLLTTMIWFASVFFVLTTASVIAGARRTARVRGQG